MPRQGDPPAVIAVVNEERTRLMAQGYSKGLVDAAIARAEGMAVFHCRALVVVPTLYNQAYPVILADELRRTESWLLKERRGLTEAGGQSPQARQSR